MSAEILEIDQQGICANASPVQWWLVGKRFTCYRWSMGRACTEDVPITSPEILFNGLFLLNLGIN
jgi:hypothetical protein